MTLNSQIINLNKKITNCKKCTRLVFFRKKIANEKRKQFKNEKYWGKPINGFGDINGKILLIGLAPAAHGGNRTGRVFTGDKSADFLYKCLYKAKMCNQPISENINDGLKLDSTYVTNILKCVPPDDKPLNNELNNCSKYFNIEISNLKKLKVIVTLGKVAFENCIKLYKNKYELSKKYNFKHGKSYLMPDNINIISSYHPSPRNVNTKLVSQNMMVNLFKKVKKISKV